MVNQIVSKGDKMKNILLIVLVLIGEIR